MTGVQTCALPIYAVKLGSHRFEDRVEELNEAGAKNVNAITSAKVLARAKAFRGPLALGAPKLQCGKYKDAPAICNDMFQAFTYEGKFQFKRASGWIGPLPG